MFISSIDLLTESNNIWFLDCACRNHMAHDRKLFQSIEILNTNEVRMGDGKTQTISKQNKVLKDVYYVPKFTHNLLSLGKLME